MKFLSGVLTALLFSAPFLYKALCLEKGREKTFSVILFLREVKSRINYSEETVISIIDSFSSSISLCGNCIYFMKDTDFPMAWQKALLQEKYFTKTEKQLLGELGRIIGTSDKQTQINRLEFIISEFENCLSEKKEKEKREKRLYVVFGAAVAFLIFIMTI